MTTQAINLQIPPKFCRLMDKSRYKAYHSGRGCAKSMSFARALLIRGYSKKLRILCAREIQLTIKDSVKQLLDDQIEEMGMSFFYTILENEIRGMNGTTFIFRGLGKLTVDQIKSMQGINIVWVEEAQTISGRSLEILVPTIRETGSELWFSWNPRHPSDPVDQLFRGEITPENAIIESVLIDDNPYFPQELQNEMEFDKKHKPDRFAHIWMGEYEPSVQNAIWSRQNIHQNRRGEAPDLERIVVAVDPAISNTEGANEHGIIVAGLGVEKRGYVLGDATISGSPKAWAQRAIATFDRYEADAIVVEINQGGDMVKNTLETIRPNIPIIEVRATRGKHVRCEPISALYDLDKISHVGAFPELESQMCQMTSAGYEGSGSPDRVDALVWAFTELFPQMITPKARPQRVRRPQLGGGDTWMG